jgi:hypothetical protein
MTLLFVAHLLHQSAKFIDASHGRPMILISVSSAGCITGIGTLAVALALIPVLCCVYCTTSIGASTGARTVVLYLQHY